jgi:two-component system nitrogen regulation sensor histidine kinase NtrY
LSLNAKLLLLISLIITASVGTVAFLIEDRAHEAFRRIEQERTETLVGQFRSEFNHEGVEITSNVEGIANSDAMQRTASELTNGADLGGFINEAAGYATTAHLDFLDLIAPDGTIISSAHWPARFGYKQRWFLDSATGVPVPTDAFLRHVETPQGTALAMLCIRPVKTHGANYYLLGGRKLEAVLQALSPPAGLRFSIYSAPEKGQGELLGGAGSNIGLDKVMPLIQKAMDERREQVATVDWGIAMQEEIIQAIPLPGYADRVPGVLLVGNSLEQELTLEKHIRNISLSIAGVAVLLGIIFSAIFASRINRPVKKLAQAATEIGHGNWDVRVESRSKDEIGKLGAAFNQMTQELIAQRERLVQTERVAAWRELARRLAHELKNPLFPLQITVENLLRARENTPDEFV